MKRIAYIRKFSSFIFIGIFLVLAACTTHAMPKATPISQSSNTITSTTSPTNTPKPTITPSATPLTGGTLNEEGPWLMYQHGDGSIYFVNPDGSGNFEIKPDVGSIANGYLLTSSNKYKILTFYEFNNSNANLPDSSLKIYSIRPFMELHEINFYPSEDDSYHTTPLYAFPYPQWSPNERYLSFVQMSDDFGYSLKVYDAQTSEITLIMKTENRIWAIEWSPDSSWIIYEEVENILDSDSIALWAITPDGSDSNLLYKPNNHWNQDIVGWVDNNRFISIGSEWNGQQFLRITNISTVESTLLNDDVFFHTVVYGNSGYLAFQTYNNHPIDDKGKGIYLLSIVDNKPQRIDIEYEPLLYDSKIEYFYLLSECTDEHGQSGAPGFNIDGVVSCIHPTLNIDGNISPDEQWILSYGNNKLCTYPENECIFQYSEDLVRTIWRNDSRGFFIFTLETVQYISLDSLTPILIDTNMGFSAYGEINAYPQWIGELTQ